eukprot:jgi/Bigna1/73661/fgenesh1_pg.25_\
MGEWVTAHYIKKMAISLLLLLTVTYPAEATMPLGPRMKSMRDDREDIAEMNKQKSLAHAAAHPHKQALHVTVGEDGDSLISGMEDKKRSSSSTPKVLVDDLVPKPTKLSVQTTPHPAENAPDSSQKVAPSDGKETNDDKKGFEASSDGMPASSATPSSTDSTRSRTTSGAITTTPIKSGKTYVAKTSTGTSLKSQGAESTNRDEMPKKVDARGDVNDSTARSENIHTKNYNVSKHMSNIGTGSPNNSHEIEKPVPKSKTELDIPSRDGKNSSVSSAVNAAKQMSAYLKKVHLVNEIIGDKTPKIGVDSSSSSSSSSSSKTAQHRDQKGTKKESKKEQKTGTTAAKKRGGKPEKEVEEEEEDEEEEEEEEEEEREGNEENMGKEDNGRVVARGAKMESNGEEDHREKGQNAVEKREGRTPVQQQQQHHAQRLSDTNSQETDVRAEARKAKSPVKKDNKLGETILRIVKAYLRNMSNPTTTTTTPSDSLPQNKLAASTSQHNNNNNNNTARIALVAAVPPPTLQSQHGVNQDSENRSDTDVGRGARGGRGEESNKVVIVTSRSEGVSTPHDSVSISHVQGTPSPTNVTLISPPSLSIRSSDASLPLPDPELQGHQHHIVQKLPSSPSTLQFFKKSKVEYQQRPKFRAAGEAALRRGPMVATEAGKHRHLRHSLPIEVRTTSFDINNNSFEEETPHGMTIVRTVRTSLSAPSLHGESTGKVVGGGAYGIKRDYSKSNGKNGQVSLPLQWANERTVSAVAAPASSRAHSPQYQSHALLNTSSSIGVSTTAKVLTAAASEATKTGSEAARQKRRQQQQQQQQQQPGSLSHASPALDSGTDQKLPQPQESKDDGPAPALTSTTMAASEEAGIENGSNQRGETASSDGEGRGEESDRERRRSALAASVLKSAERMAMAENQDADAAAVAITAKDAATAAAAAAAPTALKTVVEEESLGRQGRNNGSNTNANITSTSSHKYDGTALNGSEKQAQQTQKASGGWKVRINGEEMKTKAHAENKGEERADRDVGSEGVAKVKYKQDARGSKEKDTDSVQLVQHKNGGKINEKGSAGSDGSPQTPPLMQQPSPLHKEENRGEGGGEGGVLASMALPEGNSDWKQMDLLKRPIK